ncbi:MAG: GntR family transcriptional regulator [Propionibacteriaceae bacterium]|jgi:DNA-binding GntR family transcriptional regulator|nr:GntR family transcriptional regulator [Propionibacteriaceae bacterium]
MSGDPLAGIRIDKSSPIPLYHQLATGIEAAIRSGAQPVGSYLTNEIDLARHYGLSRPTVRQAIGELVNAGLVTRQRGVGTRVVNPSIVRPVALTSLFDDLQKAGAEPTTQVLKLQLVKTPPELRESFATSRVWELERLRSTADGPLALMHNWVAGDKEFTADALESEGLYALLRAQGAGFDQAVQRIGAENATKATATRLGCRSGAALLTMQRMTYELSGALLEIGDHKYRADRYSFESSIRTSGM